MPHWLIILTLFALGACVGSFLNVVVYRLPRVIVPAGASLATEAWLTLRGLSTPPSHCPRCDTPLAWRDNIPIFGWLLLRGRCRYCREPISSRYPIIELATALIFAGTYALMFLFDLGPCAPAVSFINQYGVESTHVPAGLDFGRDGWLLAIYLPLLACLLAASLIDAELYIIPLWIPWLMALIGLVGHATADAADLPGNLITGGTLAMVTIGGGVGLLISLACVRLGWIRRSFADGDPLTKNEQDAIAAGTLRVEDIPMPVREYSSGEVRREIRHEVIFLLPILLLAGAMGVLALKSPPFAAAGATIHLTPHLNGFLGAVFGALVGAGWVWVTRILGSIGFGREAMGMGDVHLMFGVGAILGAGVSSVAFFLAPLPGLLIHVWLLFVDPKRAVPFGPYLSMGSVLALFVYCAIDTWLRGGLEGLGALVSDHAELLGPFLAAGVIATLGALFVTRERKPRDRGPTSAV